MINPLIFFDLICWLVDWLVGSMILLMVQNPKQPPGMYKKRDFNYQPQLVNTGFQQKNINSTKINCLIFLGFVLIWDSDTSTNVAWFNLFFPREAAWTFEARCCWSNGCNKLQVTSPLGEVVATCMLISTNMYIYIYLFQCICLLYMVAIIRTHSQFPISTYIFV